MSTMDDAIVACSDLVRRSGAKSFHIGPTTMFAKDAEWYAVAQYNKDLRIKTGGHPSPSLAALALAERLLSGAMCKCRRPVSLSDQVDRCRWRLMGQRWEPGCDAPPIHVKGERGDYTAMRIAYNNRGEP